MLTEILLCVCLAVRNKTEQEIACYMGLDLGKVTIKRFADGEIYVQLQESVRGCDIFLVQPTCPPANENLMELLVMIDACRRASAKTITAVIPYFGYARADRKVMFWVRHLLFPPSVNCLTVLVPLCIPSRHRNYMLQPTKVELQLLELGNGRFYTHKTQDVKNLHSSLHFQLGWAAA